MDARPYLPADKDACLVIFDSNLPAFFAADERALFATFLENPGPYYVMEHNGAIVACGGFRIFGNTARLTWGMIRHDLHRHGLGRFLLLFRLREMTRHHPDVEMVSLETSPLAAPFYQSQGFRVTRHTDAGFVELTKRLTVCP